ncbi:MAG TPA: hypothetical protein VJS69_03860 [Candidatus Krumholzibacteria bacterium]|nr:hypothetical protein [Candidatus Krumholzibacteria bacterium]
MKKPIAAVAILAVMATTTVLGHVDARAQAMHQRPAEEPQKHPGPGRQTDPNAPPPVMPVSGPVGAPVTVDQLQLKTDVDSTMTRMDALMKESLSLSQSFSSLAALHHGADKSEILMMQRVSDAMGSMAAELKSTLAQYKHLLDDETTTETGTMRSEVDGLQAAMQVIAGEVDDSIRTLRRLEAQMGQG